MGTLLRCTTCSKEMVIEAVHSGRVVPCPWCRKPNDVPKALDFGGVAQENRRDESAGGALMAVSIVGLLLCFIGPAVGGVVWYLANGRIARARDDGRPVDPLVAAARTIAVASVIVGTIVLVVVFGL